MRKTPRGWIQIGESRTRGVARIPLGLKPSRDSRATSRRDSPIWIQPLGVFRYTTLVPGSPLPRVCLREPGSQDVKNWQCRYVIRAQMICYRNNRYLHDVPECHLVKNCPTPSGLPIPVANEIQNTIQYKDRSPDWWCLAHTMTSARAWGRSNRLLTAAICNTGAAVVLTCQEDIWDCSFYT